MEYLSLAQLAHALQKREFSSKELTQYYFKKIALHRHLNAYISTNEEHALKEEYPAVEIK